MLAQPGHKHRGEHDVASCGQGLEQRVAPAAVELEVHMDDAAFEDDVGPAQVERLADPQARVRVKAEREAEQPGVVEQPGEVIPFEDRDMLRRPVRLLVVIPLP